MVTLADKGYNKRMKILHVSFEAVPYAKVGGLADVVPSLAKALVNLGQEIHILLPLHRAAKEKLPEVVLSTPAFSGHVPVPFDKPYAIYSYQPSKEPLTFHFLDQPEYFDRPGIYTDPSTGEGFKDQGERFLFFNRASADWIFAMEPPFSVIHAHDHHVGPLLAYLSLWDYPAKRIYQIHNLAYQGNFEASLFSYSALPSHMISPMGPAEYYGKMSFMKLGITYAHEVVTVSPTYRDEILKDPAMGMGMEGILQTKAEHFHGILNGIDVEVWNPATDPHIPYRYDAQRLHRKRFNRQALREKVGLPKPKKDTPLFGMISRLVDQKGLDLLFPILETLMGLPLQMVILGTGLPVYHEAIEKANKRYPGKFRGIIAFDNPLAHLITAGSNFYLMPSRFEPCGLNQLYALRYGTLPIVRKTGGLADTVKPLSEDGKEGTGFVFEAYTPEALLTAVKEALYFYRRKKPLKLAQIRGMEEDFSWERSAKAYLKLY